MIMRNLNENQTWSEFLKKIALAVLYFLLFAFFVLLCGYTHKQVYYCESHWYIAAFIGSLLGAVIFLIIFISSWEDIFEEEDEH